jgi:hypothetical protein
MYLFDIINFLFFKPINDPSEIVVLIPFFDSSSDDRTPVYDQFMKGLENGGKARKTRLFCTNVRCFQELPAVIPGSPDSGGHGR